MDKLYKSCRIIWRKRKKDGVKVAYLRFHPDIRNRGIKERCLGTSDPDEAEYQLRKFQESQEVHALDPEKYAETERRKEDVASFIPAFIGHKQAGGLGANSAKDYRRYLEAFAASANKAIGKVKRSDSETFLKSIEDAGYSAKTRDCYLTVLKQFGVWLVEEDVLDRSPFALVKRVFKPGKEVRSYLVLFEEQWRRVIEAAKVRSVESYLAENPNASSVSYLAKLKASGEERARMYAVNVFGLALRTSENFSLTFGDIDTKRKRVVVRPENAKIPKRFQAIPLDDRIMALLEEQRKFRALQLGRPVRRDDRIWSISEVKATEHLQKDAEHAGIPIQEGKSRLSFRSLRKSFASICIARGVDPPSLQQLMRHESIQTTLSYYVELQQDHVVEASSSIADLLSEPKKKPLQAVEA